VNFMVFSQNLFIPQKKVNPNNDVLWAVSLVVVTCRKSRRRRVFMSEVVLYSSNVDILVGDVIHGRKLSRESYVSHLYRRWCNGTWYLFQSWTFSIVVGLTVEQTRHQIARQPT
jgi:hypothetical protein